MPGSTDTVPANTVAIVTGGSTGCGREFSRALAGRGYAVVVVYLDDQSGAEDVVDGIVGTNGSAFAVRADVTDGLDVERLFSETIAAFGGVDVIVDSDPGAVRAVIAQAECRLRDGGAIVTIGISDVLTPPLVNRLRARGIAIVGPEPGLEPPGPQSTGLRGDIAGYLAILDRLRPGPGDRP